jgi:hypothetical protein
MSVDPQNRTVPVTMAVFQWGRLATIADHRGTSVADLVASAIERELAEDPHRLQQLSAEVTAARRSGFRVPTRGAPADREWFTAQTRKQNLASFRRQEDTEKRIA